MTPGPLQAALAELEALHRGLAQAQDQVASRTFATELDLRTELALHKRKLEEIAGAMRQVAPTEKRDLGQAINRAKQAIEALESSGLEALRKQAEQADLGRSIDITLPGRPRSVGHLHPLTETRRVIVRIFAELGFQMAGGPQVETDFHNFEALGIPKEHPSRDMQDTFYLDGDLLLRTHTSPVQIRTMLGQKPPVRILCPGFVYRRDDDPTHSPMFMQVEGLLVDRGVSFADLKGVLLYFVHRFFGKEIGLRFRPSFFPFTEPSAEVDIQCVFCKGGGCRTCKGTGYLEIGGCGMVDPVVFGHVGYGDLGIDGFAFGMGIDRMAMLRHGVSDIKLLYENDVRFISQFRPSGLP